MASTVVRSVIPTSRGLSINPDTGGATAITVVPADSGMVFVSEHTHATTYTLPAVALSKGKMYWFYNCGTAGGTSTTCVTSTAANLMAYNTTGTSVTCDATFAWCVIFCDGTNYFCMDGHGAWTLA
jgi:invasion protein IalB